MLVPHCSRWPFKNEDGEYTVKTATTSTSSDAINGSDHTENSELKEHLMTWLSASADNIVILILLLALAVKFIFFEDRNDVVARRLRFKEEEEKEQEEASVEEKVKLLDGSNNLDDIDTTMNIWLQERFGVTLPTIQEQPVFPLSGVGGGWSDENDVECADKEVQTDAVYHDAADSSEIDSSPKKSEALRSVEDCLDIYKSEVRE